MRIPKRCALRKIKTAAATAAARARARATAAAASAATATATLRTIRSLLSSRDIEQQPLSHYLSTCSQGWPSCMRKPGVKDTQMSRA